MTKPGNQESTPTNPTGPSARPAPAALHAATPLLQCPHCGEGLVENEVGVQCSKGHRFDRARQGYLSLLGPRGRRFPGDTAEQVRFRNQVNEAGALNPLIAGVSDQIARAAAGDSGRNSGPHPEPVVVAEFGAGSGHYLAAALEAVRVTHSGESGTAGRRNDHHQVLGIGTELSVPAARNLARCDHDVAAIIADTWDPLPIKPGVVDVALVVFAPRNPEEFYRVIRPGGVLIVVVPLTGHLEPLRTALGMVGVPEGKSGELGEQFGTGWTNTGLVEIDYELYPSQDTAVALAMMGPSGVHLSVEAVRALCAENLAGVGVRVHAAIHTFKREP